MRWTPGSRNGRRPGLRAMASRGWKPVPAPASCWSLAGHLAAQIVQQITVEGALGASGVKIDLEGGDAGAMGGVEEQRDKLLLGKLLLDWIAWICAVESLDAYYGDADGAGGQSEGITAGPGTDGGADQQGLVEVGDGGGLGVDGWQLFRPLPCPEGELGQAAQAAEMEIEAGYGRIGAQGAAQ